MRIAALRLLISLVEENEAYPMAFKFVERNFQEYEDPLVFNYIIKLFKTLIEKGQGFAEALKVVETLEEKPLKCF